MISFNRSSYNPHENPDPLKVTALRPFVHTNQTCLEELDSRLIGESEIMQRLKLYLEVIAKSQETVLILGESGTGKEMIARAIHDLSQRRAGPYLAVNCGALTESLLESQLFGHVKGAFTGAVTNKRGFFEAAQGGTIFLDEFAEMPLATQQRLLRVLQERKVRPVGSTEAREIELDVRVVVATNHDLSRDILEGKFRQDLYYRVNVLQVHSPALRERRGDLLPLLRHFIRKYNEKNSGTISDDLTPDVRAVLEAYGWPGNVRELENITKRLCLSAASEGQITRDYLETIIEFNQPLDESLRPTLYSDMDQVPRKLNFKSGVRQQSSHCHCHDELDQYRQLVFELNGNLAAAARRLKIPRTTLRNRLIILGSKCESG